MRVLVLSAMALASVVWAQGWDGPYQLTTSPGADINPSVCKEWVQGNMTCLVWQTDRNGNWDIYSRFCNYYNGNGWGSEEPVSLDSADDVNPAVACCNDWLDHPSYWSVWERKESPVAGSIWASFITFRDWWPPVTVARCLHTNGVPAEPSIIVINGAQADTAWVVWVEHDTDGSHIRYSYHDGTAWSLPQVAVTSPTEIRHARIGRGRSQGRVDCPLLVWERAGDVYSSRYESGAWTVPEPVAPSPAYDANPDVVSRCWLNGFGPWVTWESTRDGDTAVFGTASDTFSIARRWCNATGAGANHTPAGTSAAFPTDPDDPRIAVWVSDRNGNPDIYSTHPFGGGDAYVDVNPAVDANPVIAAMGLIMLWCCWQSDRSGNWDIYGSYIYVSGIEEQNHAAAAGPRFAQSVVRGVLRIGYRIQDTEYRGELLDAAGRKVMELVPGPNDVRALSPGVYFVRSEPSAVSRKPSAVRKVVIAE
jgi:hypothetical protein